MPVNDVTSTVIDMTASSSKDGTAHGAPPTAALGAPPTVEETDAFLTHDWGVDELGRSNHERVARVNQALKKRGLKTWFDEEMMRGDINEKMADGIDAAATVLVFVTARYIEKVAGKGERGANDNCKFEVRTAVQKPNRIPHKCTHTVWGG